MIEASAAISTIATVIAPPPQVETQVRAPVADQPTIAAEGAGAASALRYFRFNLKYDAADQQLYVVFRNQFTGDVVEQLGGSPALRAPVRATVSKQAERVTTESGPSATASIAIKSAAPPAPGASGAPSAPGAGAGASGGSEASRGSALDSRI